MIIGLIISVLYACVVMVCFAGVLQFDSLPRCLRSKVKVHILISLYNEESRVEALIADLVRQSFTAFEVVLINDGSTDATLERLNHFTEGLGNFKVFTTIHKGKDAAIKTYLKEHPIDEGIIIVTDADCRHPQRWAETMAAEAETTNASLLIGPVMIDGGHPLQATEFLSLQGVTIGSANTGHPVMCGGANLAFKADVYNRIAGEIRDNENGADMFLLEAMKRAGEKIAAANCADAIVETIGKNTLTEFFNQRRRWAMKSGKYTDYEIIGVGIVTILMQIVLIASLLLSSMWIELLLFWLLKFCIDIPLLSAVAVKYHTPKLILYTPVASILYPFYTITVLIYNVVKK